MNEQRDIRYDCVVCASCGMRYPVTDELEGAVFSLVQDRTITDPGELVAQTDSRLKHYSRASISAAMWRLIGSGRLGLTSDLQLFPSPVPTMRDHE